MKYSKQIITFILGFIAFNTTQIAVAQPTLPTSTSYALTAKTRENGQVTLRWAPTDYGIWKLANLKGYILERASIDATTNLYEIDPQKLKFERIKVFKPLSLKEWKTQTDTTNAYNATAASALYAPASKVFSPDFGGMREMSNEQSMRYAFGLFAADLSPEAAEGMALRYSDKGLDLNKLYCYRIFNTPSTQGFLTDTAYTFVDPKQIHQPIPVQGVWIEESDGALLLHWNRQPNSRFFSAYQAERSDDGGKTFQRINTLPIVFSIKPQSDGDQVFRDSTVLPGRQYQYRVIGIDGFAEEGATGNIVIGQTKDLSAPIPPQDVQVTDIGGKFELRWTTDHTIFTDHAGYYIGRSLKSTGPFERLNEKPLPPATRTWVDESPVPLFSNFYIVYATDASGNINPGNSIMAVHEDTIPPAQPTQLTGKVEPSGKVMLRWKWGKEMDIKGYRVYAATQKNREWYQLTNELVKADSFSTQINLNSLNEAMYYTIVALDFHYNPSEYAETLRLVLPDTIAPDQPIFTNYAVENKAVRLTWANASAPDVVAHRLSRRVVGSDNWILIQEIKNLAITTIEDTTVLHGKQYEYQLVAQDDAGLLSKTSATISVKITSQMNLQAVRQLQGSYDKTTKSFLLNWKYEPKEGEQYAVYRSVTGGTPEYLGMTKEPKYADTGIYNNKDGWEYFVKVVSYTGSESGWSGPIKVTFEGK
jgi:hypothetical protein